MINVIIVDDEPLAQDILETYVEQMADLNLVQKCNNAIEANDALKNNDVDLMFLDIQMPQLTGIDFLRSLAHPPKVIFTTAYDNYAVDGFELNAIDYLLKPISMDRFMKAVNKAVDQIKLEGGSTGTSTKKGKSSKSGELTEEEGFMFVKADKKLIKINFEDVIYIEGLKDYVIIRMNDSRVITLQTMKSLEDKLPLNLFKRIHRSYIVGIDKIDAVMGNMIEVKEKGQVKHLPIGKNYREEVLNIVNKNRL